MRAANDRGDEDQPGAPGGYRSVLSKCWRRARPLYPAQPNYFFLVRRHLFDTRPVSISGAVSMALEGLSANASQNSMPKIWPDHGAQTQHGPHPTEGHHTRGHHVERHTCSPDIHLPQLSEKELFVAALDGCHIPVQLCQTLFR